MSNAAPPDPQNDHSDPQTITDLRDLVTEYQHDRNRVRDALLPTLRAHRYSAHEVTSDDLQPGYVAERAANLLRHHRIQIERLESQLSTTKEHYQRRCDTLTARCDKLHNQMTRVHNALTWGHVNSEFVPACGTDELMEKAGDIVEKLMTALKEARAERDHAVPNKLTELIEQAHENRRIGWNDNRGDEYARHWGAVAGFLRHQLPEDHPLAHSKQPSVEEPRKHVPSQIGTHDAEGFRTHMTPGDVCLGCSDPASGRWVPVSQCPQAMAALDTEDQARDLNALCPNGCPYMECYCPDGTEPRRCGHGPGGTCDAGHCQDCDACNCREDR